jgi:hypothetical protein
MTTHLSTTLQDAAERVMDYDGPAAPVNLIALADALEHAASIAAELEYAPAHSTVTGETETAYPPLVRLLGAAATLPDEPAVTPARAVQIVADAAGELERLIELMRRCTSHGGLVSQSRCVPCMRAKAELGFPERPAPAPMPAPADLVAMSVCPCGRTFWVMKNERASAIAAHRAAVADHYASCSAGAA